MKSSKSAAFKAFLKCCSTVSPGMGTGFLFGHPELVEGLRTPIGESLTGLLVSLSKLNTVPLSTLRAGHG